MSQSSNIDPIWEDVYSGGHQVRYPWDLVVSFVYQNRPQWKPLHAVHLLELGFGTANNLWFAAREGMRVSGVEGSPTAVRYSCRRFAEEGLSGDLRLGDFSSLPFQDSLFDLAIDRGSLVCAEKSDQMKAISEVRRCLLPGGRFLFNGYTDNHSSMRSGRRSDSGRISDIMAGSLKGVGSLTFTSRSDIDEFFKDGWRLLSLQRKEVLDMLLPAGELHSEWVVVAEKV